MKIKNIIKSSTQNFYLYVDAAFNHEGDKDYLFKLIKAAKKAKADGIKFQILLNIDSAYAPDAKVYSKLNSRTFDSEIWGKALTLAKTTGLEVVVLPIDLPTIDWCQQQKKLIDAIEIHSICFNEYHLLKKLFLLKSMPVFLGIGGRTKKDIDYSLKLLKTNKYKALIYGFQAFPTPINLINLLKLTKLKQLYGMTLGYADHTTYNDQTGDSLIEYAYCLGARIFEKHLTLDKGKKRIDYQAAVNYQDIREIRNKLDQLKKILGHSSLTLNTIEKTYRQREKKLVAAKFIKKDTKFSFNNLSYKVTSQPSSFEQKDIHQLINKKVRHNLKKDAIITKRDL